MNEKASAKMFVQLLKDYNKSAIQSITQGKYDDAIKIFESTLVLLKKVKYDEGIGETYYNLAGVYTTIEDYSKAKKSLLESKQYFENCNNPIGMFNTNILHANISLKEKNRKNTLSILIDSLELKLPKKEKLQLADCFIELGQEFEDSKEFEPALQCFEHALPLTKRDSKYKDILYEINILKKILSKK